MFSSKERAFLRGKRADFCIFGLAVVFLIALFAICFFQREEEPIVYTTWDYCVTVFCVSGGMLTLLYFMVSAILVYFYREKPLLPDAALPRCTIVVPAYNEGRQVFDTIRSVLKSDYPAEKLEVIAVDDGSKDDTRYWIKRAVAESGNKVIPVLLDRNGGKKAALYLGFKRASGEVLVSLDSDSLIGAEALRHLVAPFADARIGAVAGNVHIFNRSTSVLLKMLDVSFAFTFEFLRCAQSRLCGTVLCTPGALSAYRKSAAMFVLDAWLHQTFLGAPSTIGEDRALASLILCEGHRIVFQRKAVVQTMLPTTYSRICRMYLRWIRSDIRENIRMSRIVCGFGDVRWTPRLLLLQMNLLFLDLSVITPAVFLPTSIMFMIVNIGHLPLILLSMSLFSLAWATIPAVIYSERGSVTRSLWAFAYGVFFLFGLSWIPFYSLLSLKNGNWMTRELAQQGRKIDTREVPGLR